VSVNAFPSDNSLCRQGRNAITTLANQARFSADICADARLHHGAQNIFLQQIFQNAEDRQLKS